MIARATVASLPIAVLIAVTSGTDFEPDVLQALVVFAYVVGLVGLGIVFGWRSIFVFAGVFLLISLAYEQFLWSDDPRRDGVDDGGFAPRFSYDLLAPFACAMVALGVAGRAIERRLGAGRDGLTPAEGLEPPTP